jgi:hypothetical protein
MWNVSKSDYPHPLKDGGMNDCGFQLPLTSERGARKRSETIIAMQKPFATDQEECDDVSPPSDPLFVWGREKFKFPKINKTKTFRFDSRRRERERRWKKFFHFPTRLLELAGKGVDAWDFDFCWSCKVSIVTFLALTLFWLTFRYEFSSFLGICFKFSSKNPKLFENWNFELENFELRHEFRKVWTKQQTKLEQLPPKLSTFNTQKNPSTQAAHYFWDDKNRLRCALRSCKVFHRKCKRRRNVWKVVRLAPLLASIKLTRSFSFPFLTRHWNTQKFRAPLFP